MANRNHLTVGELIAALSALPLDMPVFVDTDGGNDVYYWLPEQQGLTQWVGDPRRPSRWVRPNSQLRRASLSRWSHSDVPDHAVIHEDDRDGDTPVIILSP